MNWQPMDTAPRDGTEFAMYSTLWIKSQCREKTLMPALCMFDGEVFVWWNECECEWQPIATRDDETPADSYLWAPIAHLNLPTGEDVE